MFRFSAPRNLIAIIVMSSDCSAPSQKAPTFPTASFAGETACQCKSGGGSRIRTHGALARPTVFKTAAFGRSAIPPSF
jgi:hypothetical protein